MNLIINLEINTTCNDINKLTKMFFSFIINVSKGGKKHAANWKESHQ